MRPDVDQERNWRFTVLLQLPGENTACHTGPLRERSRVHRQAEGVGRVGKRAYCGFHRKQRMKQSKQV